MTHQEYRAAIAKLGLSQRAAARLLGIDERTSRKWASGESPVSPMAVAFLTYLVRTRASGAEALRVLAER